MSDADRPSAGLRLLDPRDPRLHPGAPGRPAAELGPDLPGGHVLVRGRRGARGDLDRAAGRATRYARLANPTGDALAAAIAELEGAEAGRGLRLGHGGDPRRAAVAPAGRRPGRRDPGDLRLDAERSWSSTFGRLGVETVDVDATDLAAVEAALAAAPTRVLYVETISNPTIVVADIAALAELAHRHGALLVVDNTFASPVLCRPIELGADLVVESMTKYLGGHSDVARRVGLRVAAR